jgi:hypothetical protein
MDTRPGAEPQFSEDRQWWWDGSHWVPAGPAPVQSGWPNPPWVQRLVAPNRARWRWILLPALGSAIALAGYDLFSGWELTSGGSGALMALALLVVALLTFLALLAFSNDERRSLSGEVPLNKSVGGAARGIRWSTLFALGVSILLFANCSAGVTSGDAVSGAMSKPSQFWSQAALEMLPLAVAIALPALLATAAQVFFSTGRRVRAKRVVSLGLWSAGLLAVVAVVTTVVGATGAGECFYVSTASACAAGVGGLLNFTAIGFLLVFVPYLLLMKRALAALPAGPGG